MPNGYDIAVFRYPLRGLPQKKFQKRGLRGSKNENFEKKILDLKKEKKIAYETCATLPK